jgi:hypothetical protein
VVHHPLGIEFFEKFLASEFSGENFAFWRACRQYWKNPLHCRTRVAATELEWGERGTRRAIEVGNLQVGKNQK